MLGLFAALLLAVVYRSWMLILWVSKIIQKIKIQSHHVVYSIIIYRAINEPSFVEYCMFKLGSSIILKSSSLAWALDKPKILFELELELEKKPKNLSLAWLGLAWFISQAKLELNIKLKLELRSRFWAWDLIKLSYQMLKSPKIK